MMIKKVPLYCAVLMLATVLLAGTESLAKNNLGEPTLVLASFDAKNVAEGWKTVNDNVMGGRSKGGPKFSNGILTFTGATNTNGGGFSSIRTKAGDYDLSGKSGLLIRMRGDGRTYKAELRTNVTNGRREVPFRADFKTVKDEWREVFLPLESFSPTRFGRTLKNPPALDPAKISSFGFMIYDKKDGDFTLEVDWVKAVDRKRTSITKDEP
jgi:NADH dehydrogenase [ubiquinone] 1 alpha subcomplex assembly factor 1